MSSFNQADLEEAERDLTPPPGGAPGDAFDVYQETREWLQRAKARAEAAAKKAGK